ncbi:MAG: TIGR03960 family B12-binding radical SAM protein [Phycisphaerales bacterium]|nr:MAG: TIGR03960 family B12-binding radical SAM protein [Phycisphaerales bacterium]
MTLPERISEELLPRVEQPGQYIGREVNQLVADGDWDAAELRVAIAFPDAYTIGMSHLGCQIIYWLCNHTPGVCAERVFVPWLDAERVMRDKGIPLFTWDTRREVRSADILAISLQYEMTFTNVLTLLDLAGIPLHSAERDDSHPLVLVGGPQADNPEPLADFIDLVVLGDGEVAMGDILGACRELKAAGLPRREWVAELARRFEWLYAPNLYEASYHADGTLESMRPVRDDLPVVIRRCQTPDFEKASFPLRPLVPHVQVVHDRVSLEIMRGCPRRCRFCHAGYTKRPLRYRSVDWVLRAAEEGIAATGMNEVGLLSLSTADYPQLHELGARFNERFASSRVNIAVPSLRVDSMLAHIPWMVSEVRKSGLTIAVEAACDDMRQIIRKKVADVDLLEGVRAAYRAGYRSVKLYYMVGFPGETQADIDGIVELSRKVSEARREVAGQSAAVTASVGWLVPKPFTPLQWAAQPPADYFHEVRSALRRLARGTPVRISTPRVERSVLEAVFSRGDRKLASVIKTAWQGGARFDGWNETFDAAVWDRAFEQTGVDPAFYAHRERSPDELLCWQHLYSGPAFDYLRRQYNELKQRTDERRLNPRST